MSDITKQNNDKGIEITKSSYDKRAIVSSAGIEIRREGKLISGEMSRAIGNGFVYLLIDCSPSMEGEKINYAKNGAMDFAKEAKIKGYDVGLIKFAGEAIFVCETQKETGDLFRYIKKIKIEGWGTNIAGALEMAFKKLNEKDGIRVTVLVTDGQPNVGEPTPYEAALQVANKLKKNEIDIITIGTDDADEELLKKIATRTDLAKMVRREELDRGISSTVKMLPQLPKGK